MFGENLTTRGFIEASVHNLIPTQSEILPEECFAGPVSTEQSRAWRLRKSRTAMQRWPQHFGSWQLYPRRFSLHRSRRVLSTSYLELPSLYLPVPTGAGYACSALRTISFSPSCAITTCTSRSRPSASTRVVAVRSAFTICDPQCVITACDTPSSRHQSN